MRLSIKIGLTIRRSRDNRCRPAKQDGVALQDIFRGRPSDPGGRPAPVVPDTSADRFRSPDGNPTATSRRMSPTAGDMLLSEGRGYGGASHPEGKSMLRIVTVLAALVVTTPPALAQQAVRDCASNNHELAIRACTQLIQKNPRNAVYYYNRAVSYRRTREARPGARRLQPRDRAQSAVCRGAEQPWPHLPQARRQRTRVAGLHPCDRGEPALCDRAQRPWRSARNS